MRQRIVWVSATHIGVHPGKPDLTNSLVRQRTRLIRIGRYLRALIPQNWMKRRPFVIQRQRVASSLNPGIKHSAREFERPDPLANPTGHLVDGQSIRRDSVP